MSVRVHMSMCMRATPVVCATRAPRGVAVDMYRAFHEVVKINIRRDMETGE